MSLVVLLLLAMVAPVAYITVDTIRTGQEQKKAADQKGGDYAVTSIPLSDLVKEGDVTISNSQVNINGQLKINNSFVLTPSQAPTNPLSGQFYFSQDSNQLYYYNGTQFVDVATGAQIAQLNNTVAANSFESLSLGVGLERVGAQLVNTGVLALPQDLAVTATPSFGGLNLGSALSVGNGGTGATSAADARINLGAAESGANGDITSLTALTAVSPTAGVTYQFAPAVSGTYDFCTTAGNCATAGAITGSGTSGRLAKFTSGQVIADSLLSESGSVVTANGDLRVTQSMAVGNAGSIQDSGPVQVTLDASQNYSNTTGLTHVDGLNARINVSDTSSSALTVTGAYNETIINRGGNFAGWGYGSYSYLENGTSGNTNDINGSVSHVWNFSGGTTSIGTGLSALYQTDTGLTDWAYGGRSYVSAGASGSINNAIGLNSRIENLGNGTIANGYGVLVQSASNASGLFQNNYGMYIQDQSGVGSVSSFNLYSAGVSSKNNIEGSLQVGATSSPSRLNIGTTSDTTSAGGITLGGDTNLYRSAANTIKTDDSFKIQTATNSAQAFQVQDAGGLNVLNVDTITHDITTDNGNLYINALDTVNPTLASSGTGGTLAAGTYYYRVSAYKAGGQLSGAIDTTPSSATTTGSTSRNTLSWPAVSGAAGYYIYRSTDGGATYRRVNVGSATSAIDNGTNYSWVGADYNGDKWFNFTGNIYLEHGAGVNFNSGAAQIAEDLRGELEIANYNTGSLLGGVSVYSDYFGVFDTTDYHTNLYMDNTGKASFSNRVDSTSGFEIQNAAYQNVFTVDTSNQRIAVGPAAVPANSVLTVGGDTTDATGGITFGTDTNLYRGAANQLKTDDNLLVRTGTNSTTAFQIQNASGTPLLTADTTNMTISVQALAVTGNLTVNGHLITGGSTPSTAVNANAGVGATCTVSGTDTAGTITVTTGSSGVVAGTQCTVSFSSSFGAAPRVVVGPSNSAAGPLDPYIGSTATNNFTVGVGTAGSTTTAYKFDYVAAQ